MTTVPVPREALERAIKALDAAYASETASVKNMAATHPEWVRGDRLEIPLDPLTRDTYLAGYAASLELYASVEDLRSALAAPPAFPVQDALRMYNAGHPVAGTPTAPSVTTVEHAPERLAAPQSAVLTDERIDEIVLTNLTNFYHHIEWWRTYTRAVLATQHPAALRNPTAEEDSVLRAAARRSAKIIHPTPPGQVCGEAEPVAWIAALRADALEIFDGPECSQTVRDAIEWYHSSLLARPASPAPVPAQAEGPVDKSMNLQETLVDKHAFLQEQASRPHPGSTEPQS